MGMRELLSEVVGSYGGSGGVSEGRRFLGSLEKRDDLPIPRGLRGKGFGGMGNAAAAPWFGIFDPRINLDPKAGIYLAYIYSADLETVTLTLQQGTTRLKRALGRGDRFRSHLEREASLLRGLLPAPSISGWVNRPSFRSDVERPRDYEAASVISRCYSLPDLPLEEVIQDDLTHAVYLLQQVDASQRVWEMRSDESLRGINYEPGMHGAGESLSGFKPKDSGEYIANIVAQQQVRRKDHEAVVADFAPYILGRGYVATNERVHPRDLTLRRHGSAFAPREEWLVEVKVVKNGNPTSAVRQAVGQLREYSYFLYRERQIETPHLIGLFSAEIGVYSQYLEDQGIASIWQTGDTWEGSSTAAKWNMVD
ncbi:MrcB family domain-containing protein [Streptomyces sp. A5-4]|uniref:MrcB family domain-containing protein n=1 Tax=Streptomyces sp. A5-4 TaxID=3384771 RepID=UPI003DAA1C7B